MALFCRDPLSVETCPFVTLGFDMELVLKLWRYVAKEDVVPEQDHPK